MNDVAHKIKVETEAAKSLLSAYESIIGDDAELKTTAIEGETNLKEVVREGAARVLEIDANIASLQALAAGMKARLVRLKLQKQRLRDAITGALSETGQKTFRFDIATVGLRKAPPHVVITDETEIPAAFWKQADPEINKEAIAKAIKDGQEVPGATMSNAPLTLSIKP